jgi:hypothetical protein
MSEAAPRPCPRCGGALGEPVSADVHCYVECAGCGRRFELDDPELARQDAAPSREP